MLKDKACLVDPASWNLFYLYNHSRVLIHSGVDVDVYCSRTDYDNVYIGRMRNLGVNVYEYNISQTSSSGLLGSLIDYMLMLKLIYAKRKSYASINLMWSIFFPVEVFFFLISRSVKKIFTVHNDVPHKHPGKRVYYRYLILSILSDRLMFVSEYVQNKFIENYPLKPLIKRKSFLLQHANIYRPSKNSVQEERTLVYFGLVKKYKGVDNLINFAKKFSDFNVEIWGKWDDDLDGLRRESLTYENIKIINRFISSQELVELSKREVIFVLPYESGTQSGVFYRLIGSGRVVAITDVGDQSLMYRRNDLNNLILRNDFSSRSTYFDFIDICENYKTHQKKILSLAKKNRWSSNLKKIHCIYTEWT